MRSILRRGHFIALWLVVSAFSTEYGFSLLPPFCDGSWAEDFFSVAAVYGFTSHQEISRTWSSGFPLNSSWSISLLISLVAFRTHQTGTGGGTGRWLLTCNVILSSATALARRYFPGSHTLAGDLYWGIRAKGKVMQSLEEAYTWDRWAPCPVSCWWQWRTKRCRIQYYFEPGVLLLKRCGLCGTLDAMEPHY